MSRVAIKHGRRCDGSAALRWSTSCRYRGCSEAWPELRWSTLCQCRGCNEEWPELRRVAGAALEHPHAGVAAAMEHGRSYGGTSALRCSTAAPVLAAGAAMELTRCVAGVEHRQGCWSCNEASWRHRKLRRVAMKHRRSCIEAPQRALKLCRGCFEAPLTLQWSAAGRRLCCAVLPCELVRGAGLGLQIVWLGESESGSSRP